MVQDSASQSSGISNHWLSVLKPHLLPGIQKCGNRVDLFPLHVAQPRQDPLLQPCLPADDAVVPLGPVQGPQDDGDDRDHLREEVKGATRDGKVVIGKSSGYLTDASTAVAQLLSHLEKHLKIQQSIQFKSRKSFFIVQGVHYWPYLQNIYHQFWIWIHKVFSFFIKCCHPTLIQIMS